MGERERETKRERERERDRWALYRSEWGMIRLETLVELEIINSSWLSLSSSTLVG